MLTFEPRLFKKDSLSGQNQVLLDEPGQNIFGDRNPVVVSGKSVNFEV